MPIRRVFGAAADQKRRLYGRPDLLDRGFRQLPGADARDWKRLTTEGAVCSIIFGTIGTLVLIYLGTTIQLDLLRNKTAPDQWWYFPLKNLCIVTMTGAFLIGIVVSLMKPERSSKDAFEEMERRATLGVLEKAAPAE